MMDPRKKAYLYSLAVTAVAITLTVFLLHPATSPFAQIHDADGDGISDSADIFPEDKSEWDDFDLDGVGDNSDTFPSDPTEWNDTDGDSRGDNSDVFKSDPNEWSDADGDGHGDNAQDTFPMDPLEWLDSDADGVGDNDDFKPDGNGMIRVYIERFGGWYEDYSTFDKVDPYFDIIVEESCAGNSTICTNRTAIFPNTTHLLNHTGCGFVFDIHDGTDSVNITVIVRDGNENHITALDVEIDYSKSPSDRHVTHATAEPFEAYWLESGLGDNVSDELDCELGVAVEPYPKPPVDQSSNQTNLSKAIIFEDEDFYGLKPNGTYYWVESYHFIRDIREWDALFAPDPYGIYSSEATDPFEPDFRNYSYVYVDWAMQYGLFYIEVVAIELENNSLNVYVEKHIPDSYWGVTYHAFDFVRIPNNQLEYEKFSQAVFYLYEEEKGLTTTSDVLWYHV